MFAVEYWCQRCYDEARKKRYKHQQAQAMARGYKGADDFDRKLYRKACQEFDRIKKFLPIPEGNIPEEGRSDPRPISFGLRRWQDMFNPRQLLCLGKLIQAILKIEDKKVRELMSLTFTDSVNCNNLLCKYNYQALKIEPLFGHHAYWPTDMPIENNIWGTKFGRGSYAAYYHKTWRASKWLFAPEEMTTDGKIILDDTPMTDAAQEASTVLRNEGRCALFVRTAEDLPFLPA